MSIVQSTAYNTILTRVFKYVNQLEKNYIIHEKFSNITQL